MTSFMASKHLNHEASPLASASTVPLGQRPRRGSIASISSRLQLDKDTMAQALDQIHVAASQSETLTTFNDFTPTPPSSTGREGKGLAGELQGGLSGLYSRFRASVGGLSNLVGGVTTGADRETSEENYINNPESTVQLVKEKLSVGKVQASAATSPTAELTPIARAHSSTILPNTLSSDEIQPTTGSRSSASIVVLSAKHSGTYNQSVGLKPTLAPLTKATTSSAANPKLAEVHVVAIKDASLLGRPGADKSSEAQQQAPSSSGISVVPGDQGIPSISMKHGGSYVKPDSEDQQTSVPTTASMQLSNHKRSGTQTLDSGQSTDSHESSLAIVQDEQMLHSTAPVGVSERTGREKKLVETKPLDRVSGSRDSSVDYQKSRNDNSSVLNTVIKSSIKVETNGQKPLAKDCIDEIPADVVNKGQSETSPLDSPLEDSDDHRAAVVSVSQSHLPGFTISHASSSNSDLASPLVIPKLPNSKDQGTVTGNEAQTMSRRPTDVPVLLREHPSAPANSVPSQTRSKVLSKEYWMKDENAQDCFYCGDAFSTFRRKHHCRKCYLWQRLVGSLTFPGTCGQIFDAKCTSLVSGSQFGHPGNLRVCKPCEAIINGYDSSDLSEDGNSWLKASPKIKHNTVVPLHVQGESKPAPSASTSQHSGHSQNHQHLATPTMAIPATRRSGGTVHDTDVLEFSAEPMIARPSSSRSLRASVSGRPHSSNYKRHHSRLQHLRNFKPSVDDSAPFHGKPATEIHKGPGRLAFHNDSIIDPDLAPYLSDENSSGDEQLSISTVLSGDALSRSQDNDKGAIGGLLSAVRKSRLRFGEFGISGVTFASRDVDEVSISSSRANNAQRPRSARKRNLSFNSYNHSRPAFRSYKNGSMPPEVLLERQPGAEIAVLDPVDVGVERSKTIRSSAMIGADAPAVELNNASLQHVRKLLRQLLQDSEVARISSWERALVPILLQATDDVDPDVQNGDDLDIRHYVKLKKIPSGRPSDTSYVSGLVFTKNLALKSMPRSIADPSIVIVTFPLEYARHRQRFMSLEPVIRQEREFLENLINRIAALRPHLLLVQRNVSGLALEFLEKANIATAYNVKPSVIEAVSRCTQTRIISSIDKLAIKPTQTGRCSSFELKTYVNNGKKKTYVYLSGCPKELGCTIVLRGADNSTLAKVKRITEFMVYVVYNLKLETCLMRDEFAFIRSCTDGATTLTKGTIETHANSTSATDKATEVGNRSLDMKQASAEVSNAELLSNVKQSSQRTEPGNNTTSADIQMPEDIPAPTFYGDMVEKHKTKILSASPFVEFMQPYLLMRAREQERRLFYLKQLKDQDSLEDRAEEKAEEPQEFDLIKPEMVHATVSGTSKKVREVLRAVHDAEYDKALHNYQTQKRQWESYISGNTNLFDPYAHQNIAVLYSLVCTATSVPCSGPDLLALGFYSEHETEAGFEADCTLGQYVQDLCFGANITCTANGCERKMLEHHRQYVHGEAQLNIFVQQYPCRIRGMQDTIMMWSCCRICGNETQVMPMSKNTWKYSFGKYLELSFWSSHLHARADVCTHDLHRNHVRYFGYRNMAIRVQYDPINLLEIIVPRARITWKVDNDLRLKNDIFSKTQERLDRFMASVKARIQGISVESVVPEKAEGCQNEVEKIMKRANEEHRFLTRKLQEKYMNSKYFEIVPLNRAVRALMEKVAEWDNTFADFDNDFFPSEKDIRRLATLQLKKIFLDKEGSTSNLDSSRDSLVTPSADTELSEKIGHEDSVDLGSATETVSIEKAHDTLMSVVDEDRRPSDISLCCDGANSSKDATREADATDDHSLANNCLQHSSMQHVSHLDLAMPLMFQERQPGDHVALHPESRPVSPTTTRTKDPTGVESPSTTAAAEADGPQHASQLSTGNGTISSRRFASGIPRLVELNIRRSGITSSPPLYRAQSQPAHLRREQIVGVGKSNLTMSQTNNSNAPIKTPSKELESSMTNPNGSGTVNSSPRHSLIPRSVASRRKDSRVSTLAKHFEQLSREFEKERIRERRQRAAKSRHARAYPMASSKPIAQVYKNVHEAVEEKDPSDEDLLDNDQPSTSPLQPQSIIENMAQSITTQTPGERSTADSIPAEATGTEDNIRTVGLTASDVEGELDKSEEDRPVDGSAELPSTKVERHTITPTETQFDSKTELPKHERSSVMKLLTNFWAERSASGWTALEYPLGPSDHVFVDSDIIVREDEPSSLIALALDCDDYQVKLESIRSHGGQALSEDEKSNSANADGDMKEQADVERSLLRSTGTHLKYQFQEGSAKMACKIFFAEQFDAVRKKCGVSERMIESLSRCLKWDSKGGKTKSVFLKTLDDRLVLKSLSQTEVQTFLSFAPAYFQIMSEALFHELPSVIAKMLGFYQIIIKNPATGVEFNWFLLVMENLFYDRSPTRIFDLKGSMRNRKIQSTGEENEVLLDENMVEFIYENPLFAREHSKRLLRASVWNDTLFLARQNVMDYSLMIAIDENRKELVVGIIDCIRTYTWDKKLESWIKDRGFAGGGRNKPTVTSPKEYKSRFREAMARYVLEAPK